MSKLAHYNAFRTHALVFNTLLTTSLVVALSILVGKILKYILKLDQWDLGGLQSLGRYVLRAQGSEENFETICQTL